VERVPVGSDDLAHQALGRTERLGDLLGIDLVLAPERHRVMGLRDGVIELRVEPMQKKRAHGAVLDGENLQGEQREGLMHLRAETRKSVQRRLQLSRQDYTHAEHHLGQPDGDAKARPRLTLAKQPNASTRGVGAGGRHAADSSASPGTSRGEARGAAYDGSRPLNDEDDHEHESDGFFFAAPVRSLGELEERFDRVERFCIALALDGPLAEALMRRAQQARYAIAACAIRPFSTNLRRALGVKVVSLELEARAAVWALRRGGL
jgi:hypothetical protein